MDNKLLHNTKIQIIEKKNAIKKCHDVGKLLILIAELDFLKWRLQALNEDN